MNYKLFLTRCTGALLLCAVSFVAPAFAQEEGELNVVNEVVAQVNNDVITLAQVRREMSEAASALREQRGITQAQAETEVARRKPEIIASLITEQLLVQQGKDAGLTDRVEAEVNRRLVELANSQGIKTIADLEKAMVASGIQPEEFRASARRSIMTSLVLNQEVDGRIYFSLRPEEVKKYYDENQNRFRTPETVELSEIFLTTEGKTEADVRARAAALVAQLRGGADFAQLASANSDRDGSKQAGGKLGTVTMDDISRPEVAAPLKTLQAGGVTDPISTDGGYLILRVDKRTPAGAPAFDETKVREVMTYERAPKERTTYIANLRKEAFVKVAEGYREEVEAALNKVGNNAATTNNSTPASTGNTAPAANATAPAAAPATTNPSNADARKP